MKTSESHIYWTIGLILILISQIISAFTHKPGRSVGRHGHHNPYPYYHHHPRTTTTTTNLHSNISASVGCPGSKSCEVEPSSPCPLCPPPQEKEDHQKSNNRVCGSDGLLYPTHCDLHRNACLTKSHIFVNHQACLHQHPYYYYHTTPTPTAGTTSTAISSSYNRNRDFKKFHHHHHYPASIIRNDNNNNTSPNPQLPSNLSNLSKLSKESRNQNPRERSEPEDGESSREKVGFENYKNSLTSAPNFVNYDDLRGQIQNDDIEEDRRCTSDELEVLKNELFGLKMSDLEEETFLIDTKKLRSLKERNYWSEMLGDGPERDKDDLLRLIFRRIDTNEDYLLQYFELYRADLGNVFGKLNSSKCQFRDFLSFDDTNGDGKIHVTEFYSAFSHLYGVTMISLEKALERRKVSVNAGERVELKCDVLGSPPTPILWRFPSDLSQSQINEHIRLELDGRLILVDVEISLRGDYTCQSVRNEEVLQTHTLQVKECLLDVLIYPKLVMEYPGPNKMVTFECEIQTKKYSTDLILNNKNSSSYKTSMLKNITWSWFYNKDTRISSSTNVKDSNYKIETFENGTSRCSVYPLTTEHMGTFSCQAGNSIGNGSDTATLLILNHSEMEKG